MPEEKPYTMKTVGRRTSAESGSFADFDVMQRTITALRRNAKFAVRGVYRFRTHEEADQWMMDQLTRP